MISGNDNTEALLLHQQEEMGLSWGSKTHQKLGEKQQQQKKQSVGSFPVLLPQTLQ